MKKQVQKNCTLGRYRNFLSLLLLLSFMASSGLFAQSRAVTGQITADEDGESLPGVNILIKGTTTGTVTDIDGNYRITAPSPETILVFSSVGFVSEEITVGNQSTINMVLSSDVQSLSEVVVIGYGTQEKKEVTGAVAQVDNETLSQTATPDIGTALQGQIAGVNVQASSGAPGATANILIRGLSSVTGANQPLYVVDGIPFNGDPKLSINEIETIDVLKDAASAAVYGTRGAGGVILITTKRGKAGQMKIGLDSYVGFQNITSDVPLMNFEDDLYARFLWSSNINGTNFDNTWTPLETSPEGLTNRTDLRGVLQNDNALIQNHSLSVSGGKEDLTYSIVGTYFSQDGVLINSGYDRFNVRANTSYSKNRFQVTTSLGMRIEEQTYEPWQLLLEAYKYHPFQQAIDPNQGTIQNVGGSGSNEAINVGNMSTKLKQSDVRNGSQLNGNIQVDYSLTDAIRLTSRIGGNLTDNTRIRINPLFKVFDNEGEIVPLTQRSGVYNYSDRSTGMAWENSISYDKEFGNHHLRVLGVFSMERYTFASFFAQKFDLISNDVTVLNGATLDPNVGTGTNFNQDRVNSLIGMLGRIQYDYKGKYLLSVSARRDGSSRFSQQYRWGTFPSVSAGWNISDERFWEPLSNFANAFKVRASYGTTGNQNFLDYSNAATITLARDYVFGPESDNSLALGAIQTAFANENVKWETTEQTNVGFDLAFLQNKLTFTGDFYNTNKQDMLFPLLLPTSTGAGQNATVVLNVGDMNNRGMEFATNYRHQGKFSWSLGGTFATNQNKITKMSGSNKIAYLAGSTVVDGVPNEDRVTVLAEGYEAGSFFVIETDGIISTEEELATYQELVPTARLGDLRYVDQLTVDTNGDGIPDEADGQINNDDRVYAGSGMPDFEVGLNFSAQYAGFDFTMQWYAAVGGEVINGSRAFAYKFGTHQDLVHQWSPQNTTSNIPANRGRDHENYRGFTDYWIEDGTFIRLRNVALGYSIPRSITERAGISKLRVYIAAQNPLTFTEYSGFDPEVGNNGLQTRGLDKGNYPISTQYRAGIQLDF
ncbi:MAG: TonB-dependent receptor [Bacteroidota bacterium]